MKKELPPRPQASSPLPPSYYTDFDRCSMTCEEVMDDVPKEQIDQALKQGFYLQGENPGGTVTMSRIIRFTM